MNFLVFDTSCDNLTIALKKGNELFGYKSEQNRKGHSTILLPEINQLLQKAELSLSDIDYFGAVVGPGSFTGIRIGVSTAKALCFAYGKPCLAITSFDTLAYNEKQGKVLAIIDAKHNGFYVCGYEGGKVSLAPEYVMRERLLTLLEEYVGVCATAIDGVEVKIVSTCQGLINAIEEKQSEISKDPEMLNPLYVRKSQAEEGR